MASKCIRIYIFIYFDVRLEIMSPKPAQPSGLGDILFLVQIPSALASASTFFVSVHYLLNQLMDYNQTCIYTLLGRGEELIRFW